MSEYVKCASAYCKMLHKSRELQSKDAVYIKKKYYHKDCYEISQGINSIVSLFYTRIDRDVIMSQLVSVIRTLVFEKGVHPDYLTFGINYYLDRGWNLKHPPGLFYVVKNDDVKRAWDTRPVPKSSEFSISEETENSFTYKPVKARSIENLFS